jgi:MGT family glycosyltransferase
VLVTLGTVHAELGEQFYATALEALSSWPGQVILTAPAGLLKEPLETVIVTPSVPWLELLPHVDAVVCHGGFTTVSDALAHELPLVVAPIKDDHMLNAGNVTRSGAGIRVSFARVRPPELRQAVEAVLGEPSYREAAARIAASFREAGGARAAADAVELLARGTVPGPRAAQPATGAGRNSAKRSR